ncbi:hypothetical protein A2960_05265 [Candidatus Gottesmanbacteria bacterium RIFCSPLOWO2_01_FULL_39_12b]|uniref:Uncharacterized protein n=1 Tax=Candidatus Gottesmanbacteria bacterium RIFCSPLOWO2_01_FULL_39_12b TaxID=1798388 RepID=A0A1F6AM12_9BACT|nr:MAG: hypothetical protein A2960_05265 [Candidatus Gottesmanbacteria bacterium RIFCSPLOWO2_01_FULL_39_12b]
MPKKYIIVSSLLIIYISSFIFLNSYYTKKIRLLTQEKNSCQIAQVLNPTPHLELNDVFLYGQKMKAVLSSPTEMMFFSNTHNKIDGNSWQIIINLEGNSDQLTDSANLQLDYDNGISDIQITPGDAFPLYPKIIQNKTMLSITGIATISQNNITYGQSNKIFATLLVHPNPTVKKAILTINNNSKIYFLSQNILDQERTFKEIELE